MVKQNIIISESTGTSDGIFNSYNHIDCTGLLCSVLESYSCPALYDKQQTKTNKKFF